MKYITVCFLIAALLCTLAGCAASKTLAGAALANSENVVQIQVSSLPESETYQRSYTSPEKIKAVTDYIDALILSEKFPENPNEYTGMTWVITYVYKDGTKLTLYHFGNMFFRAGNGSWHRMTYEQAAQLDSIISQNLSD